jgi:hypothetical protein
MIFSSTRFKFSTWHATKHTAGRPRRTNGYLPTGNCPRCAPRWAIYAGCWTAATLRAPLCIEPSRLAGQELWLDGYNVLTILESALAGGIVLLCRDGCCRDIAGIHRRYCKVSETIPVLRLIGEFASAWGVSCCRWWLDKPVSNSGRLKALILDVARDAGWKMDVELSFSPDHVLSHTEHVIATSDGIVLDRCRRWVNLARLIVAEKIPQARLLDLSPEGNSPQENT